MLVASLILQCLQALAHALTGDKYGAQRYLDLVGELPEGWSGTLYSVGWQTAYALNAHAAHQVDDGFAFLRPLQPILSHIELWVVVVYAYGKLLQLADETGAARKYLTVLAQQAGRPTSAVWQQMLQGVYKALLNQQLENPLTEREIVVLTELASDDTLLKISERMFVSVNTLKTQTRHIYRKLGVTSRAAAVQAADDLGVLSSVASAAGLLGEYPRRHESEGMGELRSDSD